MPKEKSYQSEFTGCVVVSTTSVVVLQFAQGGLINVSEGAVSAFAVALVSFVIRQIQKRRDK